MFHFDYKCAKDKTIRTCKGSDDSFSLVGRFVACVHAGGADARLQSSCFGISWAGRFDSRDGVCMHGLSNSWFLLAHEPRNHG